MEKNHEEGMGQPKNLNEPVKRRDALKRIAQATGAVALAPLLSACGGGVDPYVNYVNYTNYSYTNYYVVYTNYYVGGGYSNYSYSNLYSNAVYTNYYVGYSNAVYTNYYVVYTNYYVT